MYTGHFSKMLISHEQIIARTKAIAALLAENYNSTNFNSANEPLVLICILKGSSPFYSMLLNELSLLS